MSPLMCVTKGPTFNLLFINLLVRHPQLSKTKMLRQY